jgi:hypothetical protein
MSLINPMIKAKITSYLSLREKGDFQYLKRKSIDLYIKRTMFNSFLNLALDNGVKEEDRKHLHNLYAGNNIVPKFLMWQELNPGIGISTMYIIDNKLSLSVRIIV